MVHGIFQGGDLRWKIESKMLSLKKRQLEQIASGYYPEIKDADLQRMKKDELEGIIFEKIWFDEGTYRKLLKRYGVDLGKVYYSGGKP